MNSGNELEMDILVKSITNGRQNASKTDKSIEMLVEAVAARMRETGGGSSTGLVRAFVFLNKMVASFIFVQFIASLIALFTIFRRPGGQPDTLKSTPIPFKDAHNFRFERMYGKEIDIEETVKKIVHTTILINELTNEQLHKILSPADMATLVDGDPGTGKTMFVKVVACEVDRRLREEYLKATKTEKEREELKRNNKYQEVLDGIGPRVKFAYITPSIITGPYVGQTEQNIRNLFLSAEAIAAASPYTVVIILFDEAEAFFKSRKRNRHGWESTASSELLARIAAVPEKYEAIFLFAVTNYKSMFDDAFIRRFGNSITFNLPDQMESENLIRNLLHAAIPDYKKTDLVIEKLRGQLKGKSQAFIADLVQRHLIVERDGQFKEFDLEKTLKHCRERAMNSRIGKYDEDEQKLRDAL